MRRIMLLVVVALVMGAVMASSALPAWAVPISEMSCAQLKQASEEAGLDLAFAEGQREADLKARLAALGKEAERKGCGEFVRNSGGGFNVKID
jgi:opacity protein-like surface antigen